MNIFFILFLLSLGCDKNSGGNSGPIAPASSISIEDASVVEGNSGTTNLDVNVRLNTASAKVVTVRYHTTDGDAKGGEDFTAVADGLVTFQPGETVQKITITVTGDDKKEPDETFTVTLVNASNATVSKATANLIIRNDDTKIAFSNAGYEAPTSYAGYNLVWADEFNGSALDATAWSHQNGDGCPNLCGWGNNELEYYTDRAENLYFQDGKMIIEAKKENYSGKPYTSSKILTAGKKAFKFGRIDIRAKLPKGKGIWPAFWLLPKDNVFGGWPRSGEIDLMEVVGHEPNKTHGTLHYGSGPGSIQYNRSYTLPGNATFNDEFHVFSIEWKQDQIKWFVDGNLFSTANKADFGTNNYPFNEEFYLIINLAVGGNWPGNPDATTTFPQWLIVDYLRVYQ